MVRILTTVFVLLSILVISAQGAELRAAISSKQATSRSIIRGLMKRQSECDIGDALCDAGDTCCPIGGECCSDGNCCDTAARCVTGSNGVIGCCLIGETCTGPAPDPIDDGNGDTSGGFGDDTDTDTGSVDDNTFFTTQSRSTSRFADSETTSVFNAFTTSRPPASSPPAQTTKGPDTSTSTTGSNSLGTGDATKSRPAITFIIAGAVLLTAITWL
ncbi:hypothetical protein VKT23_010176 [Stygiomarasmius scandens]|uniref:GPI anchored protein n=1 Tax=Marasmiellus scandens TaxID=2682957 RepID=A0ABR1JD83_9AGAR